MEKKITDEMIEKRRLENARAYKRQWRVLNKEHLQEYSRIWHQRFKDEHGESYGVYRGRQRAKEQLMREESAFDLK